MASMFGLHRLCAKRGETGPTEPGYQCPLTTQTTSMEMSEIEDLYLDTLFSTLHQSLLKLEFAVLCHDNIRGRLTDSGPEIVSNDGGNTFTMDPFH